MSSRLALAILSFLLLIWKPVDVFLSAIGMVDTVRSMMDQSYWFTSVLLWPHLGTLASLIGLSILAILVSRPFRDKRVAYQLNELANWAIPNIRDGTVTNVGTEAQLQRDFGRWHQRVEDRIAPYAQRFSTEHSSFITLGGRFPTLPGISFEHQRLRGMVDLKVVRLRALAKRIQDAGPFE